MARLIGIFGALSLAFAIADFVHGQHNGDSHRFFIHVCEFVAFLTLLCLLEIAMFRTIDNSCNLNRWFVVTGISLFTIVLAFLLFVLSGGSFHGDGGPIASSFLILATIGYAVFPVALVGSIAISIVRFTRKTPIIDR